MDYTDELKGSWVWRYQRKAHLIESVIAGELITKCGRRLISDGWEVTGSPMPDSFGYCQQCVSDHVR